MIALFLWAQNKEKLIHNHQKTPITLSDHEMNRIAVVNSRIAQVFGVDGQFHLEFDQDNGQIFLKPKGVPSDTTITIVTEDGFTQDLDVSFEEVPSQTVLFKTERPKQHDIAQSVRRDDKLVDIIKFCLTGKPVGFFVPIQAPKMKKFEFERCIFTPIKHVDAFEYVATVYEVVNPCKNDITIDERLMVLPHTVSIYMSIKCVRPGKKATCVIVRHKENVL